MKKFIVFALMVSTATIAAAQQTSTSGSNSTASSGSLSGAQSNNANSANNAIGNSSSNSNAGAVSGSDSASSSNGNQQGQGQGQTQGQSANNSQGQQQSQGQMVGQANGQNVDLTFNSKSPDHLQVKTNTPVGLTASSSFSSDYCGATASAGASAAPLGISIGASGPRYDRSCQSLRRAEKFGMAAANAHNMGQPELAQKLMSMMIWSICMADTDVVVLPDGRRENATATACSAMGLMGQSSVASLPSPPPPPPTAAPNPRTADNTGKITPEAAIRALAANDAQRAVAGIPH